jgi:hypothetical protein
VITLYTTGLIVALFLVPGFIFRSCFAFFLPLRKFQRTRIEEVTFAAKVSALPLAATLLLAWITAFPLRFPIRVQAPDGSLRPALQLVVRSALDAKTVQTDAGFAAYMGAAGAVFAASGNLLLCFYFLLGTEACILGRFSSRFGDYRQRRGYGWLMEKILLPGISEWHVLLTTFASPRSPARLAVADILTTDDHLYHGQVENYYLDGDGKLTGILLAKALRFDRQGYLRALQAGPVKSRAPYWKQIPGKNVYVFAERITNLNLNYEFEVAFRLKNDFGLDPTLQLEIESP